MAVRFDTGTDRGVIDLSALTLPFNATSLTVCGWVKLAVDRNAESYLAILSEAHGAYSGSTNYAALATDGTGTMLRPSSALNGNGANIQEMTVGTWYFWAIVLSSGSGVATCYVGDKDAATLASAAITENSADEINYLVVGNSPFYSDYPNVFNGSVCGLRAWTAALTEPQLRAERDASTIQYASNRLLSVRLATTSDVNDTINSYNVALTGAADDADEPAVFAGASAVAAIAGRHYSRMRA